MTKSPRMNAQSRARRVAIPTWLDRLFTAAGLPMVLLVGVAAMTTASVPVAYSATETPAQPVQALESLHLKLAPDGTVTSIGRTDMTTTNGSSFNKSSGKVVPSTASRLPVVVSTAWVYNGQTGTDLSKLEGKSGLIELDVTVTNTSSHPEPFTVTAPDNSQLHTYALVSTPVTVVGSVDIPAGSAADIVLPRAGRPGNGVTNGTVSRGANTTVQWSAVLAPPRLAPSATFRLVLNGKNFKVPNFSLSAQAGLVSDPSVETLYDTAFGQNSPLTQIQNATAQLTDKLSAQIGTTGNLLDQIRSSMVAQGATVGPAALQAFNSTATTSLSALDSILTSLRTLDKTAHDLLSQAKATGQASLAKSLTEVEDYLGVPATVPNTNTSPNTTGLDCSSSLSKFTTAKTLYDQVSQIRDLMYATSTVSNACIEVTRAELSKVIGTSTDCSTPATPEPLVCQLATEQDKFSQIQNELNSSIKTTSDSFTSTQKAFDSTVNSLDTQVVALQSALLAAQSANSKAKQQQILLTQIATEVNTAISTLSAAQTASTTHADDLAAGYTYASGTMSTQIDKMTTALCKVVTQDKANGSAVGALAPPTTVPSYDPSTNNLQGLRDTIDKTVTCLDPNGVDQLPPTTTSPLRPAADDMATMVENDIANWQKAKGSNATVNTKLTTLATQLARIKKDVNSANSNSAGGILIDLTNLFKQSCALLQSTECKTAYPTLGLGSIDSLQASYDKLVLDTDEAISQFKTDVTNGMSGVNQVVTDGQKQLLAGGSNADNELRALEARLGLILRGGGDNALTSGYKALGGQNQTAKTLINGVSTDLGKALTDVMTTVHNGVTPSISSVKIAKSQLQTSIAKALGDLRPVIAMFTSKATEIGQAGTDLGAVQNQATGFSNVRRSEVFDQLLATAQLNQGLAETSKLPYFGSSLPGGSKHTAVYAFTIGGQR